MKRVLAALALAMTTPAVVVGQPLANPPNVPVHIRGEILSLELVNPRAIVHLRDEMTGKLWAVETFTPNSLLRSGVARKAPHGRADLIGYGFRDDPCQPECRGAMREMNFSDGGRIALGGANPRTDALKTGDWKTAAAMGATAADVVLTLQSRGRYADLNAWQSVVVISPDNQVEATAMKPLPSLEPDQRGATANLNGSGFSFGAKPGSVILYPAGTQTFGPASAAKGA